MNGIYARSSEELEQVRRQAIRCGAYETAMRVGQELDDRANRLDKIMRGYGDPGRVAA